MKKLIKVTNAEMAQQLHESGYKSMIEYVNEKEIHVFLGTDDLLRLLNDKKRFSKKHWYREDNVLRF